MAFDMTDFDREADLHLRRQCHEAEDKAADMILSLIRQTTAYRTAKALDKALMEIEVLFPAKRMAREQFWAGV